MRGVDGAAYIRGFFQKVFRRGRVGPLKAVVKLCKIRKIGAKLIFFLSNIDSPYQRYAESTTPRITNVSVMRGVDSAAYLEEGGVVCIFFLSFFLLAVEREIETKAETFRYRSLLSEQNQNLLIWSAYYRNKSRTFQSVPKLFKIKLERFGVF